MQPSREFAFRLCLALGFLHPDYLLRALTSRQLSEWMAYYRLHPFGQDYTDYLVAQMTAEISNRWRGKTEEARKPSDYLPLHREPEQTPQQIKSILRGVLSRVVHKR